MVAYPTRDVDRQPSGGPSVPQPTLDPNLVGHWRHTDGGYAGEFSMTTDTHLSLFGDGRAVYQTRTVSSFGDDFSPDQHGRWYTQNGLLYLKLPGDHSVGPYVAYPDRLLLPNSHLRLWYRVG